VFLHWGFLLNLLLYIIMFKIRLVKKYEFHNVKFIIKGFPNTVYTIVLNNSGCYDIECNNLNISRFCTTAFIRQQFDGGKWRVYDKDDN
jgi:hypothetical protein